jgi:hypothetical protein
VVAVEPAAEGGGDRGRAGGPEHPRQEQAARLHQLCSGVSARGHAQDAVGEDGGEDGAVGRVPEEDGVEGGEEDGPAGREEEVDGAVVDAAVRRVVAQAVARGEPGGDGELRTMLACVRGAFARALTSMAAKKIMSPKTTGRGCQKAPTTGR